MASGSGVQQQFAPQQQHNHPSSPHHCKECGIYLNSAESLGVHLDYHKENLLNKWATQAAAPHDETNNNNIAKVKRESFLPNTIAAAADSSDSTMLSKKSPDCTTPEVFGHPPTPQSYHSAASPYHQGADNSAFSPGFQTYPQMKQERTSPGYQTGYGGFAEPQFYTGGAGGEAAQYPPAQPAEFLHKSAYRYHPYQQGGPYDRSQGNSQVSSSSPAFPPQPTPSPSPKQCDKCGHMCDSATQLLEHRNMFHPYHPHFMFNDHAIKTEDETQSEILDLDSHKVHQVYPEEEKQRNGGADHPNPHPVTPLLHPWSPQSQQQQQQQKMFPPPPQYNIPQDKLFHDHFLGGGNNVSTSTDSPYRPFDPQPNPPVISSTQVPAQTSPVTKSSTWKSNEARRPKTYNCTACNKWFTSSGHLKRHYNTTLHKNAVKSSGQPDPASMPISAHHHPARDPVPPKEDPAGSPADEDTNSMPPQFEQRSALGGGLLQQPPSGPYDRQPPNIHHTPPLHSPIVAPHHNGSPPNGEAGLSPTTLDSRGLLSLTSDTAHRPQHGFAMAPPPMMAGLETPHDQFQMYPNGSAPHVTQAMATNSHSITGEHQVQELQQPLPSFAHQFHQAQRYGGLLMSYGNNANVGGGGPATAPYSYYSDPYDGAAMFKAEEDEYRLTVLTVADAAPEGSEYVLPFGNPEEEEAQPPPSPEKAHTKRDFEEGTGSPSISSSTIQAAAKTTGVHKCIDCDKLFNKACYLTQHNKTFHCGDKPYKCTRCGKRFSSEVTYQEHLAKHAGDKPHKCEQCPKQFNHKTDLRRHMCLHTGQKPYSCDTCGKGFIRKDHMLKHCETHLRKNNNNNNNGSKQAMHVARG